MVKYERSEGQAVEKERSDNIISGLAKAYPDAKPALRFADNYQLLVAVVLSAQCTDERVNKVTADLFAEYGSPEKMATLTEEQLGEKIFSCGLYRSKAAHILSATRDILTRFGGQVPSALEDLQSLAGVGRKTANVVYSVGMGGDAIAVDTHVFRVSNRLGIARGKDVLAVEKGLMAAIDKSLWSKAHHYLIYHGRRVCRARKPDCGNCPVADFCEKNGL